LKVLDIWNEFIHGVTGNMPGFPIWADVFTGQVAESSAHPAWKNGIIKKNAEYYRVNDTWIRAWLYRHGNLAALAPSFRKLEWQAGNDQRDIWDHAIQFRPSGIRVRPLTYLPALVAITQTSIIGPMRRRITPREAAQLQGFPPDFPFLASDAATYRQLGNAVSVGSARLVARSLLSVTKGVPDEAMPPEWRRVLLIAETRHRAADVEQLPA
jgi:DNA (cytosine-5)-methyltransferase 1